MPDHAADPALAETYAAADGDTLQSPRTGTHTSSAPTITVTPGEGPGQPLRASLAPPVDEEGTPRYEAGPLLGVGGMGEVRLHVDRRIGRPIALKTLKP